MSRVLPDRRAVGGPLSPSRRVGMTLEIVLAYAQLLHILRRRDLPSMVAAARRTRCHVAATADDGDEHWAALRFGRLVQLVVRCMPADRRCLIHSLVLVRILARRSIDARVVIGVSADDGFAAHAWVEHDGRPVLPNGRFERLLEL